MAVGKYMSEGQQFAHITNSSYDRYFTKLYDGVSVGAIVFQGEYYTPILVSKTPEGASCHCEGRVGGFTRDFTLGNGVYEIFINGEKYYYMFEWGLQNTIQGEVDIYGDGKTDEQIIIDLLGLQPLDSNIIIVKWTCPVDSKVLSDTYGIKQSTGNEIGHDYHGEQE